MFNLRVNWDLLKIANYTPMNIKRLLRNMGSLFNGASSGDTVAHSILIDLEDAINADGVLSSIQKKYLLLWVDGYTMREIGLMYGRSQQSVSDRISVAARNISKYLKPDEKYLHGGVVETLPTMVIYEGQNIPIHKSKRIITIEAPKGQIEYGGKCYDLFDVKQHCSRCGSDKVEMSIFRRHAVTGKVMQVWRCWNCEVNYDIVCGLGTREGLFHA